MNIIEALKAREIDRPYIVRKAWLLGDAGSWRAPRVLVTDAPDRSMLAYRRSTDYQPWVPSESDLLADDWGIVPSPSR